MIFNNKRLWKTDPSTADQCRRNYVDGIQSYIDRKNSEAQSIRFHRMTLKQLEEKRMEYRRMLGIDTILMEPCPCVEKTYLAEDDVSYIYRLTVYITKEIPMYALLLFPKKEGPMPLVVAQHGGGGTPELCSDYAGENNYNHMVQRALQRGAAVIAPQLLLWSLDETGTMRKHDIPFDRYKVDNNLKRFNTSITALEIAGIIRCIDYACDLPEIDEEKIGMVGLSYGGYFTLHTMAAETRIKAGYAAGFFNNRDIYDWIDWCYKGSALKFQDAEVAALCIPRKLCIAVGKQDTVFDYHSAIPEGEKAKEYYAAFGYPENIRFSVWEGAHTMEDSDDGYEFLFNAFSD